METLGASDPPSTLTTAEVRRLLAACGPGLAGMRDRALVLPGYAGALRRSELAAVRQEDSTFVAGGLRLAIPRGKTDAAGQGAELGTARGARPGTCPVRALEAWLRASDRRHGPVFRKVGRRSAVERAALTPEDAEAIEEWRAAPRTTLEKPVGSAMLAGVVRKLVERARGGSTAPPRRPKRPAPTGA